MLLTVKERIVLGQALIGVRGNLTELRIIRQLREDLSFSEEEHKELNIQIEGDGIFWNTEGEQPKEIEIGDVARKIIVNRLRELNAQHILNEDHLDIIDKFPEVEEIEEGE